MCTIDRISALINPFHALNYGAREAHHLTIIIFAITISLCTMLRKAVTMLQNMISTRNVKHPSVVCRIKWRSAAIPVFLCLLAQGKNACDSASRAKILLQCSMLQQGICEFVFHALMWFSRSAFCSCLLGVPVFFCFSASLFLRFSACLLSSTLFCPAPLFSCLPCYL